MRPPSQHHIPTHASGVTTVCTGEQGCTWGGAKRVERKEEWGFGCTAKGPAAHLLHFSKDLGTADNYHGKCWQAVFSIRSYGSCFKRSLLSHNAFPGFGLDWSHLSSCLQQMASKASPSVLQPLPESLYEQMGFLGLRRSHWISKYGLLSSLRKSYAYSDIQPKAQEPKFRHLHCPFMCWKQCLHVGEVLDKSWMENILQISPWAGFSQRHLWKPEGSWGCQQSCWALPPAMIFCYLATCWLKTVSRPLHERCIYFLQKGSLVLAHQV